MESFQLDDTLTSVANLLSGDLIGVPYAPPYLAPATKAGTGIITGVSYASAAGGIIDPTGANYVSSSHNP